MTKGAYAGYLLEMDLTEQTAVRIPLPESYRQQSLGGKALAAQILWEYTTGREGAFSPENLLVIATAPLTGTDVLGSRRFDVASLSPKDNLPAFSNCGGDFGWNLKQAGYDALILRGKASVPLWLEISETGICFHGAVDLRGLGTGQCRKKLEEKLQSQGFVSLCIGPAGENLVRFSSLVADGHSTGRAGLGAVLGWKQLKAVVISGKPVRRSAEAVSDESCCQGCALHCIRHSRKETPVLDELGLDAIGAEDARDYASRQGWETENLYEAIAFRTGIGDRLAEGVFSPGKKGGRRRSGSHARIAGAFGLPLGEEATEEFCRNFLEAVSVCGQCMFTVKALQPGVEDDFPVLKALAQATGQSWDLKKLLALGKYSRELEQRLKNRFQP